MIGGHIKIILYALHGNAGFSFAQKYWIEFKSYQYRNSDL